ncbi:MAG: nucleosidase [Corynebacterium sp.]|nr:nucleosidase [Corynebacterium sp.]
MSSTLYVAALPAEIAHIEVPVLLTGIGLVRAAITVTEAIASLPPAERPDRIVNIGTAGALVSGMSGVYEITHATQHDFFGEGFSPEHFAAYDLDPSGVFPTARLASGSSFVSSTADRQRIAETAELVDMEGFAIAAAGQKLGIPVTLLKWVSDSADENALESWDDAVDRGSRELNEAIARLQG